MVRGGEVRVVNVTSGASVGGERGGLVCGGRREGKGWDGRGGEGKGRRTYWVVIAEAETETVCLVEIEGVGVEDSDVHLPFFEVGSGD